MSDFLSQKLTSGQLSDGNYYFCIKNQSIYKIFLQNFTASHIEKMEVITKPLEEEEIIYKEYDPIPPPSKRSKYDFLDNNISSNQIKEENTVQLANKNHEEQFQREPENQPEPERQNTNGK